MGLVVRIIERPLAATGDPRLFGLGVDTRRVTTSRYDALLLSDSAPAHMLSASAVEAPNSIYLCSSPHAVAAVHLHALALEATASTATRARAIAGLGIVSESRSCLHSCVQAMGARTR